MKKKICWQAGVMVSAVMALSACGGGSDDVDAMAASAARLEATRTVDRGPTMRAKAAVPGVDATDAANQLFAFAEATFKNYFPTVQSTRKLNGWAYRYYPETGVYLAVIDWRVYAMGGPFGPEVQDFGDLTQYVSVSPPPNLSVLSAGKLAMCPDASASAAKNYYSCMVGTLTGTQLFDTSKVCKFAVAADGELSLQSDGVTFKIPQPEQTETTFSKNQSTGTLSVFVVSGVGQFLSFDIDISAPDGTFFTRGGTLKVDAKQNIGNGSLSCKFNVAP